MKFTKKNLKTNKLYQLYGIVEISSSTGSTMQKYTTAQSRNNSFAGSEEVVDS